MFTLKVNFKHKRVKKAQKCKNRNFDSTHGRAAQCRTTRTVRACRSHGRASLTTHIFQFFLFHRLAHKIQTINPISMLFSPTQSLHLALSHSTEKSCLSHPKTDYLKSLILTYLSKSLKLVFHSKTQVLPKTFHNQNI